MNTVTKQELMAFNNIFRDLDSVITHRNELEDARKCIEEYNSQNRFQDHNYKMSYPRMNPIGEISVRVNSVAMLSALDTQIEELDKKIKTMQPLIDSLKQASGIETDDRI